MATDPFDRHYLEAVIEVVPGATLSCTALAAQLDADASFLSPESTWHILGAVEVAPPDDGGIPEAARAARKQ